MESDAIFLSMEEVEEFYRELGFTLTNDHRLIKRVVMTQEVITTKIGPELLRSHIVSKELK